LKTGHNIGVTRPVKNFWLRPCLIMVRTNAVDVAECRLRRLWCWLIR